MSVTLLLVLFIGLLLAAAGLVLLIWLLWRLWTHAERKEEPPVIELRSGAQPAGRPQAVPPARGELEVPAPALGETESGTRPVEVELVDTGGGEFVAAPVDAIVEEPAERPPLPGAADDLKLIEGIGPRIAGVLHEAGIETFAQLAATDADRLQAILREADPRLLRLADPGTWPEQARLAAVGEWDALTDMQRGLRAGRRR